MKSFFRTTTPLHEAVKQNKGSIVAALLQLGADSDSKDFPLGRTAFQYAEWSSAKEELTAIFRKYPVCKVVWLPQRKVLTCSPIV